MLHASSVHAGCVRALNDERLGAILLLLGLDALEELQYEPRHNPQVILPPRHRVRLAGPCGMISRAAWPLGSPNAKLTDQTECKSTTATCLAVREDRPVEATECFLEDWHAEIGEDRRLCRVLSVAVVERETLLLL
jgi:hypothetical protein